MTHTPSKDALNAFLTHLQSAEPDMLRAMVRAFAEQLMSAEVDALCGAAFCERSAVELTRFCGVPPVGAKGVHHAEDQTTL